MVRGWHVARENPGENTLIVKWSKTRSKLPYATLMFAAAMVPVGVRQPVAPWNTSVDSLAGTAQTSRIQLVQLAGSAG